MVRRSYLLSGTIIFLVTVVIFSGRIQRELALYQLRSEYHSGNLKQAYSDAVKLSDSQPNCAELQFLIAKLARRCGNLEVAHDRLNQAEGLGWDAQDIRRERLLSTAQVGNHRSVEGQLDKLLRTAVDRDAEEIYEALARGFFTSYQFGELTRCTDFWLAWHPDAVEAHMLRADAAALHNNLPEAISRYKTVLRIDAENDEARFLLAEMLFRQNQFEAALKEYARCEQKQSTGRVLLGIGRCHQRLGSTEKAIAAFDRVKDQATDTKLRSMLLEERGRIALENGDTKLAVRHLKEVTELIPSGVSGWNALANAYAAQGNKSLSKEASETCENLRKLWQQLSDVRNDLLSNPDDVRVRMKAARLSEQLGNADESMSWAATVLQIQPDHPGAAKMVSGHLQK